MEQADRRLLHGLIQVFVMHHVLLLHRLLLLHCLLLLLHRLLLLRQQLNKVWWHGSYLLQLVCGHHNALLCFSYDFSLNFELLQNFNIFQHNFSIACGAGCSCCLGARDRSKGTSFFLSFLLTATKKNRLEHFVNF